MQRRDPPGDRARAAPVPISPGAEELGAGGCPPRARDGRLRLAGPRDGLRDPRSRADRTACGRWGGGRWRPPAPRRRRPADERRPLRDGPCPPDHHRRPSSPGVHVRARRCALRRSGLSCRVCGGDPLSSTAEDVVRSRERAASPARRLPSLRRAWRALRTGIAFTVFGLGAVLIGVVALPVLRLTSRRPGDLQRRTQVLIHLSFRLFAWFMTVTGLIRVTWVGRERLRERPLLVIANHPTLIDVVLLVAAMPQ